MAMLCASSSFTSAKPSCSYSTRNGTSICTTPFVVGFSFSQSKFKPCVKTSLVPLNNSSRSFEVRCEKKEISVVTRVPLDQRWLFEESELDGPYWHLQLPFTFVERIWRLTLLVWIWGAFVIVVNAEKVAVSGKKRTQKLYRRHSGRPGGMKVETFDQLQQRIPERIIEHAVRGMLPKGRLGRALFNHLKVYTGPTHPHEAQKPIDLPIRDKRIQMER
ncbi:hypothetical protein OIU77_015878 [Salix suchowensis]|uniref:50S ribosomal protein L13, chloroplastic n=1 Tax=Salix suchowensis TaxID=1278906 RepID=A0ABQ8ZIF0_9ROSI|nr:hypothetical protein OIU77_015878 [Salix suchowensis]